MYTTSIFSTSSGEPHRSPRRATAAPERRLLRRAAPPLVGRALASSYLYGVLGATRALPPPSPSDARTRTRSRSTAPPHAVHTIPRIGHKYRLVSCLSVSSGHTGSAESKNSIGKLPARDLRRGTIFFSRSQFLSRFAGRFSASRARRPVALVAASCISLLFLAFCF